MDKRSLVLALLITLFLTISHCKRGGESSINWYKHKSFKSTMDKAAKAGKPIIFEFYVDWCPYCARLEETIFKDKGVIEPAKGFFCVKVNGDLSSADQLMAKYHVKGYPTLIFSQPDGTPTGAWQDLVDVQLFTAHLEEMLKAKGGHPSWAAHMEDALPTGKLISDEYFEEAEKLEEVGDKAGAKKIYRRGGLKLLNRFTKPEELKAERSLVNPTIVLLIRGGALDEAEKLSKMATKTFPEDFLYYHLYASVLKEKGDIKSAVRQANKAFALAYGRNRLRVADLLTDILIDNGNNKKAKEIILKAIDGVDWKNNTRKKELTYKETLQDKLAKLTPL